jgi:hypothetical protein
MRSAVTVPPLIKEGFAAEDASAGNTALISALRFGGDSLNVSGDFPTLADPRHADAYSPLRDAQLSLWTPNAVAAGLVVLSLRRKSRCPSTTYGGPVTQSRPGPC